jgi:pyruvate/2-oxoglutarate dehydrogenase complex dihydrolipoamide acyltransferase (E2) component
VVEVDTDKAVMTVDAPVAGHLTEILVAPTTVVLLGQQLGTIRPEPLAPSAAETRSLED